MKIHQESKQQLKSFQYHKYNSSLFSSKALDPLCSLLLPKIPPSLTPALLSMIGLSSILISYTFSLFPAISSLHFIITALSLFIYQLCDSLNQKVAIRNETNSIVNLMYDHLADHIVCCVITLTFCNLLQVGLELEWVLLPLVGLFPFYLKYLNLYYLDKMVLDRVNPVDEGVLVLQGICWISAIQPNIWVEEIFSVKASHLFILLVLILQLLYLITFFLEIQYADPKFSGHNFAPILATSYIFICYYSMNPYLLQTPSALRILEWTFILVHTVIIGRILVYYASGERFKPVSFGYLLVVGANVVINVGVWLMEVKDQIIVGGMLGLIVGVLVVSYTVVWVVKMVQTLKGIVGE